MTKHTIVYYTILKYQPENVKKLHDNFKVIELENPDHDHSDNLSIADVIIAPLGYYCGKEKIDAAPSLKIIASNTTGHPHIDVGYAEKKGIRVITLKDDCEFLYTITPTAELTWGLIIALTRNIISANKSVIDGKWDRRPYGGHTMLSKMTLGVVGYGRLGKMVVKYGQSFGMNILYYDPNVFEETDGIYRMESLEKLVKKSDIITVHVPHEKETENMFDQRLFSKFKKGSYFINTSRGELVDCKALLEALEKELLSGAALDVLDGEFDPDFQNYVSEHPLVKYAAHYNNLILTPHIGGSTYDAWRLTEARIVDRVIKALKKQQNTSDTIKITQAISRGIAWGFIPARGGSKSIPLKNMVELDGRPLIDYVIRSGSNSKSISRIFCSTENFKIKEFCKKRSIEICDRPEELAGDNVPSVDVILHFLTDVIEKEAVLPEYLVLLEPTSPFVLPEHINKCIEMLRSDPSASSSQTVCRVEPNSHAYNQRVNDQNGSHFIFPKKREHFFNKQLKPEFFIHGNVRVMRVESVMRTKDIFGDRSLALVIPKLYGTDVDGPGELELARCICHCGLINISE